MAVNLVLVITAAGLIGFGLRYVLPLRDRLGLAVVPSTAIIAGSLGWALAMWVGFSPSGIWGWVIALGLSIAAPIAVGMYLPRRRDAADEALWENLVR